MANGLLHRMREIAGSLDLLEQDLLRRRDRRDECLDPLVVRRSVRRSRPGALQATGAARTRSTI